MMPVYAVASGIASPLGLDIDTTWSAIEQGNRGIQKKYDVSLGHLPFWASQLSAEQWHEVKAGHDSALSRFESLCLYSMQKALSGLALEPDKTVLVLSSTKGNIDWLGNAAFAHRISLNSSAQRLAACAGSSATVKPMVVSHACVSGVIALQYASALLRSGRFEHAIVVGGDLVSKFVLSGFQSFQAIANEPCRPFDAARKGINLGEAAATIILSRKPGEAPLATLYGGATTNDANHISGPSRTGAELALAMKRTLDESGVTPAQVDAISAHGTATIYNDEMEAKAFAQAGVPHAPLHSLKGYFGHTLGAAGILESVLLIESLRRQILIASPGYENSGVSEAVNVTTSMQPARLKYALKTASGFGGCNAAILWGAG